MKVGRPGLRADRRHLIAALAALQAGAAVFFLADIVADLAQGATALHSAAESAAVVALLLSSAVLAVEFRRRSRRLARAEAQVRLASGAFAAILRERFEDWDLTPAEQEVAVLALKGLQIAEIARLRGRAEGTVKAQLASVYAKAGVSGRPQFLSLFIEDLLSDGLAAPR